MSTLLSVLLDTANLFPPVPERVIIEQIPPPIIPTVSSVALCDPGDTVLSGSYVTNGSAFTESFEPLDTLKWMECNGRTIIKRS